MAWKAAPSFSRSRLACQCPVIQVCVNDTDICDMDIRDSDICDSDIRDSDMHDSDVRDSDIRDSGSLEGPASGPGPGPHLLFGRAGLGRLRLGAGSRRRPAHESKRADPGKPRAGSGSDPARRRDGARQPAAQPPVAAISRASVRRRIGDGRRQARRRPCAGIADVRCAVICRAKVAAKRRRRRRNEARETQAPAHAGTRIPPTA